MIQLDSLRNYFKLNESFRQLKSKQTQTINILNELRELFCPHKTVRTTTLKMQLIV